METVIAFAVLTAAILGPVTLVAFSLGQTQASQNKLIATNLGQEGIELIRAIRENNVICNLAWNTNPNGGTGMGEETNNYFTVDANDRTTAVGCTFSTPQPTTIAACDATSAPPLNLDANGIYTHHPGPMPTPFRRCVTICVPATSAPCNGAIDPDVSTANDQIEVLSKVFWTDHGLPKSIEFRERLYNWR